MKKVVMLATLMGINGAVAWGMPVTINYQGSLKQTNGSITGPATGTHQIRFEIIDGTAVVWQMQDATPTDVVNGLFSVVLTPVVPDWQTLKAPYLRVYIDGEQLSPDQPINAGIYALMSQSVVDGAVTSKKLAPEVQDYLVPKGAIMMFAGDCPTGPGSGWTRFAALDNRFPMGSNTYGAIGGTTTHSHSISMDGAHNHSGYVGDMVTTSSRVSGNGSDYQSDELMQDMGTQNFLVRLAKHIHPISTDGTHNHGGFTGQATNLPPYLTMIFCQKN